MIVFGHYAISTRTLRSDELPFNFQLPADAKIQKIVRVAHIFWIPIFPFETLWGMKQNGKLHKVNPEIARLLNQTFGPVQIPWFSFSLPILIVGAFIFFKVDSIWSNREAQERQKAINTSEYHEALYRIDAPLPNDYFLFKTANGYVPGKLHKDGTDSLTLLLGEEQQYQLYDNDLVNYFANPNALSWSHTLAKNNLKNSCAVGDGAENAQPVFVGGALQNIPLKIEALHRLDLSQYQVRFKDKAMGAEVYKALKRFIDKQTDTDATLAMLDSASITYFREMLQTAKTGDFKAMKAFTEKDNNTLVNYKNMVFTRYVYLSDGKIPGGGKTDIKDYAFFLKLLNQGLWRIDFEKNDKPTANARFGEQWFSRPTEAKIVVNMDSDQLNNRVSIPFEVVLHKEKGSWKINLLSTYGYTTMQLYKGITGMSGNKEYRKMVLDEIKKTANDVVIDPQWAY